MLLWFYNLPLPISGLLIVTPVLLLSVAGTLLFRRFAPTRWGASRDAIGVCVSAVGVIYAVLLAMIAVAAWEHYSRLEDDLAKEASLISSLFRDAGGLAPDDASGIRQLARRYVGSVYCDEMVLLRSGSLDASAPPSEAILGRLIDAVLAVEPRDLGEANVHRETLQVVDSLVGHQRSRLLAADAQLLPVLWAVVLIGGFVTLALTWLTIVEDVRLNLILNVAYGTMVGLIAFSIFALDRPFWGEVSVSDEPFAAVAFDMERMSVDAGATDCLSERRAARPR